MKPAARRSWLVGDRFRYNRWAFAPDGSVIEGAVFEITEMRKGFIYFIGPGDRDGAYRRTTRVRFLREVRRRLLVRER